LQQVLDGNTNRGCHRRGRDLGRRESNWRWLRGGEAPRCACALVDGLSAARGGPRRPGHACAPAAAAVGAPTRWGGAGGLGESPGRSSWQLRAAPGLGLAGNDPRWPLPRRPAACAPMAWCLPRLAQPVGCDGQLVTAARVQSEAMRGVAGWVEGWTVALLVSSSSPLPWRAAESGQERRGRGSEVGRPRERARRPFVEHRGMVASMHAHGRATRCSATPRGAQLLRPVGHDSFSKFKIQFYLKRTTEQRSSPLHIY
jgi:hypothetical protein